MPVVKIDVGDGDPDLYDCTVSSCCCMLFLPISPLTSPFLLCFCGVPLSEFH